MFHRNLFKVSDAAEPDPRHGSAAPVDGQTTGNVSDWLRDVDAADGEPELQVELRQRVQAPAAAVRALRARSPRSTRRSPRSSTLPNKTNGYQRKAQATIGSTTAPPTRPRSSCSSAAWGHEGGNGITVEFVNRPGADLPLSVEVNDRAVRVLLAKNATGALASTATQVAAAIEAGAPGLIDRAHPYRTNARHRDRAGDDGPGRADRLPRPEAHRRAGGRGAARAVHDPRAADRQAP